MSNAVLGSTTAADLHLREYVWASRPRLRGDAVLAMQWYFDYCLENRLSAKLAGDIFHTLAVLPEFVSPLFQKLDQMQEAQLPVYYVQGNHDLNKVPWLTLHKWPVDLHGTTAELEGTDSVIRGIQSTAESELQELLSAVDPAINTLLMHQAETKAMPFGPNFDLSDVPEHIRTVLIGDIHKAQSYANEHTTLYYPGSLAISEISQVEPRQFLKETGEAGGYRVEYIQVPGRNVYNIDINTVEDLDLAEAGIRQISENDPRHFGLEPIIHVTYPPALSESASQRMMMLRDPLQVYTWLDTKIPGATSVLSQPDRHVEQEGFGSVIEQVIHDHVSDEKVRDILLTIFMTRDVPGTLRSEMERSI